MAESLVAVTQGSGKNLHTWNRTIGANSVEDEYVLLGENGLASYMIVAQMSTATADSHLLQIMAGASLKVRVRRIEITQLTLATTVTLMDVALLRLTSAGTGGTAVTPQVLDTADGASGATGMKLPTAKGTEGGNPGRSTMYMMQTLGVSATLGQPGLVWDFDRPRSKPLVIPAGAANGLAIKNVTAVAAGNVTIQVWIDEANF